MTMTGDAIRRVRRAQHISDEMVQIAYHSLELDVEHGVGGLHLQRYDGRTTAAKRLARVRK